MSTVMLQDQRYADVTLLNTPEIHALSSQTFCVTLTGLYSERFESPEVIYLLEIIRTWTGGFVVFQDGIMLTSALSNL